MYGYLQSGSSLCTELAVKNKHSLLGGIATNGGPWLGQAWPEKQLFHSRCGIDVDSARDMSAIVLIIETTVNHVVISDLGIIRTIKEIIQLQRADVSRERECQLYL
jgi:hypothetical protein